MTTRNRRIPSESFPPAATPIPGYPDYAIEPNGNVWSIRRSRLKQLTPIKCRKGYLVVCLSNERGPKDLKLHYLSMITFVGPRPEGLQINHKNGIKTDNRPSNLEYCTASENVQHAYNLGLKSQKGVLNGRCQLTLEQVHAICRLLVEGLLSYKEIGDLFGVDKQIPGTIKTYRNWKEVGIQYGFDNYKSA